MKNKFVILRKMVATVVALGLVTSSVIPAFAAVKLYEKTTTSTIVKGVSYENKKVLNSEGWLDLHIMTVDLSNPDISFSPVLSQKEVGLRETVASLLQDNNAIAGVNASYFGLTSTYSSAFGPQISDGEILSLGADINLDANQFGTYYVNSDGSQYFDYFKTYLNFYVDGVNYFEVAGINTITEMIYPVYLDRNGMSNTQEIDARFSDITKIVVEDDVITKISAKGETVSIPSDGYVIALGERYAEAYIANFSVGQSANFEINTSIDIDKVETAISGGGVILKNGVQPTSYGEMATGRQPRTLLGVSADGNTMKLIVVEGQRSGGSTSSIGLTVEESVALLQEEGMYNGLNLDGGGSSIMAGKESSEDYVLTLSEPAEGTQRTVMSAVGIFDSSDIGKVESVVLKADSSNVVIGTEVGLDIFGYDENYHKIQIASADYDLICDETMGTIENGKFIPSKMGEALLTVDYEGMRSHAIINIADISSIIIDRDEIDLEEGSSFEIVAQGLSTDGYTVDLQDKITYETTIGTLDGNVLTVGEAGVGYVKCSYEGVVTYVKVNVGTEEVLVNSFENIQYLNFTAYPSTIEGIAGVSGANYTEGSQGLGLSYYFADADITQAAYLEFPQALPIDGRPTSLSLDIKGNGTGQWVRAVVIDGMGTEKVIEFSRDVNWTDWQTMIAEIPQDIVYPISLKRIYVAALTNDNTEQQIMYFDNLRAEMPIEHPDFIVPQSIVKLSAGEGSTVGRVSGYEYITFTGNVVGETSNAELYTSARVSANNTMGKDSDYSVFVGTEDISAENGSDKITFNDSYTVINKENITLLNMVSTNGGLRNTQQSQWQTFVSDGKNSSNRNIIIYMDKGPNDFIDTEEADFFRSAVKEIADSGKNVYVLYANASTYSSAVQEGVRYISLPNLWDADGDLNSEYRILRFKADENTLAFEALSIQ